MNIYLNGKNMHCPASGIRGTVYPVVYGTFICWPDMLNTLKRGLVIWGNGLTIFLNCKLYVLTIALPDIPFWQLHFSPLEGCICTFLQNTARAVSCTKKKFPPM